MEKKERDFKGVWIPKILWLNTDLSIIEKCLLVEIDSLDNDPNKGCWASNEYLGQFIGVSEGRCANIISALKKRGYISQVFFDGRNRGLRAHYNILESITKSESSFNENVKAQLTETLDHTSRKREHSNIDNNTSNNTEEEQGTFFPTKDNKQHEQAQPNKLHLERKKESHPPVPLAPPPLKNKGKKDRASIAIPTSLNNADFLAEWEKLLQTKKWKGKEDSTLEGILEKLSTFDVRFATELANQARLNEWQGIIFAQTGKNYEMWLKSTPQSNNSPETVQLSVLANSGLKTLKIARTCKAYEIAERLVDKQTGVILNEAISQEDKAYISWITKNITNHINNNTIDKQEWFCEFVTRKI